MSDLQCAQRLIAKYSTYYAASQAINKAAAAAGLDYVIKAYTVQRIAEKPKNGRGSSTTALLCLLLGGSASDSIAKERR